MQVYKQILIFIVAFSLIYGIYKWKRPAIEEVSGSLEDCCCTIKDIDRAINGRLFSILEELTSMPYFRYFKVDNDKECTLWPEGMCTEESCGIKPCDPEELPSAFKDPVLVGGEGNCNTSPNGISDQHGWKQGGEDSWIEADDKNRGILVALKNSRRHHACYVNLKQNPERFTGYGGDHARQIWTTIYKEICVQTNEECQKESNVFRRLISGFHASTTAHIAEFSSREGKRVPNLMHFIYGLGMYSERMSNIYFTLAFLMRAVDKESEFLRSSNFSTGNPEDESRTKALVQNLLAEINSIPECHQHKLTYNESSLFLGKEQLKAQFKEKFRNISSIMNCVECATCRLHSKLQMLGMGTALKILLSQNNHVRNADLEINEIIALINTIYKFAESIKSIHLMKERAHFYVLKQIAIVVFPIVFVSLLISALVSNSDEDADK